MFNSAVVLLLLFVHPGGNTDHHKGVDILQTNTLQECVVLRVFVKNKFEEVNPGVKLHGLCVKIDIERLDEVT